MNKLTNKNLQRMKELMGNKTPITENISNSSISLVKKSPNGKSYGVVRENTKYFIKESNDGVNFDFIGGVANKTKNQFHSFEEATKRLNLMFEDFNRSYNIQEGTDILSSDIIEEKRFVLKSKKKSDDSSFDFGGGNTGGSDFDFGGGEDKGGSEDFDFGGETEGDDTDFDFDSGSEDLGSDEDIEDDDPIKGIQKMTGKLGQKIRDTEDLSSDTMKWVAKSIISALDLEAMDSEDKKDIIRAVKKQEDEGSDEDFDFMDDETEVETETFVEDDILDWSNLSQEDKEEFISSTYNQQHPGDLEEPLMDWEEEIDTTVDYDSEGPFNKGTDPQYMMFPPEEVFQDYMDDGDEVGHCKGCKGSKLTDDLDPCLDCEDDETYHIDDHKPVNGIDYMGEDEMYGPSSGIDTDEVLNDGDNLFDPEDESADEELSEYPGMGEDWMSDETYPYHEVDNEYDKEGIGLGGEFDQTKHSGFGRDRDTDFMIDRGEDLGHTDYMAKFSKDVARNEKTKGRNLEMHEIDTHVKKLQNKLGGSDVVTIDGNKVVGDFGYVEVTPTGYTVHKEGSRFGKKFRFDELGKVKSSIGSTDYMTDPRMMPQTAPTKPTTRPETPVKPGKPGTDKPSPSKRPFTPPPHITPGEEPDPKAEYEDIDYMHDDETCPVCNGRGIERGPIGFGVKHQEPKECQSCGGTGTVNDIDGIDSGDEISEPYVNDSPIDYTTNSTSPKNMKFNYSYKEKFPFKIDYMDDNDEILDVRRKSNNPRMMPQTAPTKPITRPETPVKPGKPGTDKPTPSKRPFTPPPHITPGEEPDPKARKRNRFDER